jgi:hypothetical protein
MALQLQVIDDKTGASIQYIRVMPNVRADKTHYFAQVVFYATKAARDSNKLAVSSRTITVPILPGTPLQVVYDELKKLPGFIGAVDV